MSTLRPTVRIVLLAAFALLPLAPLAGAQSPPPAAAPPELSPTGAAPPAASAQPPSVPLSDFAWLSGCWRGIVNQREFREHWLPLRGNLLIGAGHTVMQDRTQNFEYVRIEPRGDALYYVAQPSGGRETAFRLADRTEDGADTIFTFASDGQDFPQRIVFRRGSEGWLYIHVEGRQQGEERRVIYPLRRIDCESGEILAR
jgi:hypothetical protein